MKAVGFFRYLPISDEESFLDLELDMPSPGSRDLLVKVDAVSVNPVDTKVRAPKGLIEESAKVLGFDAAGTVVTMGEQCTLFTPGDKVFYAGDIMRQGSNSEFQLVDERIVGYAPKTLSTDEAAAIPLTALTAWEALFERMQISLEDLPENNDLAQPSSILIIGGAGGVGSLATQMISKLTSFTVIATASRDESIQWCKNMGADHVINHHEALSQQLKQLGINAVDYILCCNNTDQHFSSMVELIAPQGHICSIVDNTQPLPLQLLKPKSVSFSWEFMFTRAKFQTKDMIEQHHILNEVSRLLDEGILKSTLNHSLSPINASNLKQAHALIEGGKMIGKLVLQGW